MAKQESRVTTADKIATLIRIYRSAVQSGDRVLAETARAELSTHGVEVASKTEVTNAVPQ
jgi:hypothetical protein